jgi:hypothetical protein
LVGAVRPFITRASAGSAAGSDQSSFSYETCVKRVAIRDAAPRRGTFVAACVAAAPDFAGTISAITTSNEPSSMSSTPSVATICLKSF